jgi:STAS-like domain of unknown function (DUF4325)
MITIDVGKDFSRFPSGRYAKNGTTSGEAFRVRYLEPALRNSTDAVQVVLDGTIGYGSSFLEEAFGGLVRVAGFKPDVLANRLSFVTTDDSLKLEVQEYITEAAGH